MLIRLKGGGGGGSLRVVISAGFAQCLRRRLPHIHRGLASRVWITDRRRKQWMCWHQDTSINNRSSINTTWIKAMCNQQINLEDVLLVDLINMHSAVGFRSFVVATTYIAGGSPSLCGSLQFKKDSFEAHSKKSFTGMDTAHGIKWCGSIHQIGDAIPCGRIWTAPGSKYSASSGFN